MREFGVKEVRAFVPGWCTKETQVDPERCLGECRAGGVPAALTAATARETAKAPGQATPGKHRRVGELLWIRRCIRARKQASWCSAAYVVDRALEVSNSVGTLQEVFLYHGLATGAR